MKPPIRIGALLLAVFLMIPTPSLAGSDPREEAALVALILIYLQGEANKHDREMKRQVISNCSEDEVLLNFINNVTPDKFRDVSEMPCEFFSALEEIATGIQATYEASGYFEEKRIQPAQYEMVADNLTLALVNEHIQSRGSAKLRSRKISVVQFDRRNIVLPVDEVIRQAYQAVHELMVN